MGYFSRLADRVIPGLRWAKWVGRKLTPMKNARTMRAYAARKRTMRGYRRRAAYGLATSKTLTTVKDPVFSMAWPATSPCTYTYRFCPFAGYLPGQQASGDKKWYHAVGQMDPRFEAFCDLYREFRIANLTISLKLQSNPYNDTYGFISFVGKVIRNCTSTTAHTFFYDGTNPMFTPGIVWKRNTSNTSKLPGITLSVYPKVATERQQWYPTTLTNQKECMFFTAGTETDFCPAIDFACAFTRKPVNAGQFAVAVQYRATFIFRDPVRVLSDSTPETKVLEVDREDVIDMANAVKMIDQAQVQGPIQSDL